MKTFAATAALASAWQLPNIEDVQVASNMVLDATKDFKKFAKSEAEKNVNDLANFLASKKCPAAEVQPNFVLNDYLG